ncbi:ABC transporter permease [Jiangella asiatica]|uniref:ABC transporter permease n=1 Tax=Jiangella asiatica TaxID=2530372 RepID=A0A4R5CRW6_9ACTN|nr:ABC transporter permease [Jiangella asiatica]TDE01184.1 ABC transporter permease [Jiangella asiatica]
MAAFVARRLGISAAVFLLISIGIFVLVRAAPGDPVSMMVNPEDTLDGGQQFVEAKRRELGLDQPVPVQYLAWLRHALTGDLGYSYVSDRPVLGVLAERLPPTVELMGTALLIALVIAVPLGMLAAVRRNTAVDYMIAALSVTTISIPSFFLGIAAVYVLTLKLGVLPSAGMSTPGQAGVLDAVRHLILPALILSLTIAGPFVRYVRSGLIDELDADYVRTAEAKGATTLRVLSRHALPNALIPLVTVVALRIPHLLAGAVVLEQVFAWPGMGQLAVSSIGRQDYPVIIGFALYVAVLVLICNLAADLLYAVVDPRVRLT